MTIRKVGLKSNCVAYILHLLITKTQSRQFQISLVESAFEFLRRSIERALVVRMV